MSISHTGPEMLAHHSVFIASYTVQQIYSPQYRRTQLDNI